MNRIITMLLLTFCATSMYAGGFRVALQSAKQSGMGYVGTGMSLGTESIYFNPGAIGFDKGGVTVSAHGVFPTVNFTTPGTSYTTTAEKNTGTPFAIAGTFNVNDKVSAGLAVYTPFGNRLEWEDGWAGSYLSEDIELSIFFAQPTISYKVNDKFGVGAGLIYSTGSVTLDRRIPLSTANGDPKITVSSDEAPSDFGYTIGAFYQPNQEFSLGVNYRSKIEATVENGNVEFEGLPVTATPLFQATKFNAMLPLPAELSIGTGVHPTERLTIAADMNYLFWSEYKELAFDFNNVVGGSTTSVTKQDWEDSVTLRIGGEYDINDQFIARLGGYYDFTPVPDASLEPITPDQDRLVGTLGLTYMPTERFAIDGTFMSINGQERTVQASESNSGFGQRYKISANVAGLGLNYKFNK